MPIAGVPLFTGWTLTEILPTLLYEANITLKGQSWACLTPEHGYKNSIQNVSKRTIHTNLDGYGHKCEMLNFKTFKSFTWKYKKVALLSWFSKSDIKTANYKRKKHTFTLLRLRIFFHQHSITQMKTLNYNPEKDICRHIYPITVLIKDKQILHFSGRQTTK